MLLFLRAPLASGSAFWPTGREFPDLGVLVPRSRTKASRMLTVTYSYMHDRAEPLKAPDINQEGSKRLASMHVPAPTGLPVLVFGYLIPASLMCPTQWETSTLKPPLP